MRTSKARIPDLARKTAAKEGLGNLIAPSLEVLRKRTQAGLF
ncbi:MULTISPECIES: hypothetical protein [Paenibacillus]|nr:MULTISPECIES: hypothetical protein [Paenibacillus]